MNDLSEQEINILCIIAKAKQKLLIYGAWCLYSHRAPHYECYICGEFFNDSSVHGRMHIEENKNFMAFI